MRLHALALVLALPTCAAAPEPPARPSGSPPGATLSTAARAAPTAAPAAEPPRVEMAAQAKALQGVVTTLQARAFLERAALLPEVATRALHRKKDKSRYYEEAAWQALSAEEKAATEPFPAGEEVYYYTKYGSPLSYARPLDILFARGLALGAGSKMLDFGYGYAGHLRMLATMGVDASGVDVDPLLPVLYGRPGDQGAVTGPGGEPGRVRLIDGRFPADPAIVAAVGSGYDLVISKNVLKRGYIHPDRPAEERVLIRLGVPDEVVVKSFFDALKPGGLMLVYNICPALSPPDKPFVPWSDGRSPFSAEQWRKAGFEILELDRDDAPAVRVMGHALGWGVGDDTWDLEHDLSVLYTLVKRP